jgi:hypothetical protein
LRWTATTPSTFGWKTARTYFIENCQTERNRTTETELNERNVKCGLKPNACFDFRNLKKKKKWEKYCIFIYCANSYYHPLSPFLEIVDSLLVDWITTLAIEWLSPLEWKVKSCRYCWLEWVNCTTSLQ